MHVVPNAPQKEQELYRLKKLMAEGGRGFNPCKKPHNERGFSPGSFSCGIPPRITEHEKPAPEGDI